MFSFPGTLFTRKLNIKHPHILPSVHRLFEIGLRKAGFEYEVRRQGDLKIGIWKRTLSATPNLTSPKRFVFIPGFLDTPLSWTFVLARVLPRLKNHYDEFAILDFPGFAGFLHRDRAFEDVEALTESAFDALDSLRPHALAGHSLGGYLAALYASQCGLSQRPRQENVKRQGYLGPEKLILAAPSGLFVSEEKELSFMERFREAVREGFPALRPYSFFKEPPGFDLIAAQFHSILLRDDIGAFIGSVNEKHSLKEYISALKCPTWLIWGEADKLVPTECTEAWQDAVSPEVRRATVLLKKCGHNPQIEKPFQMAQVLLKILRAQSPAEFPEFSENRAWRVHT